MASMDEEEMPHIPRARRMSVKRISQQAKEELAKQSVQEETSLRRESMAQHVSPLVVVWTLYQIPVVWAPGPFTNTCGVGPLPIPVVWTLYQIPVVWTL